MYQRDEQRLLKHWEWNNRVKFTICVLKYAQAHFVLCFVHSMIAGWIHYTSTHNLLETLTASGKVVQLHVHRPQKVYEH